MCPVRIVPNVSFQVCICASEFLKNDTAFSFNQIRSLKY